MIIMAIPVITPQDMVADLDKKIAWFDANPPRDKQTGEMILDQRFIAQVNMLKAMRNFIASKIDPDD